jgi:HPt (histidine-containing phosphotransfer) domain-containing protein
LVETFIAVGGAQLDDIEYALRRDDIAAVAHAAHKLKSNSGAVFAADVSRLAARLESETRELPNTDGRSASTAPSVKSFTPSISSLASLVDELRREFTRIVEFLRSQSP